MQHCCKFFSQLGIDGDTRQVLKKACLNLSLSTSSSVFDWMAVPIVELPEWIDLLPKPEAGGNNG